MYLSPGLLELYDKLLITKFNKKFCSSKMESFDNKDHSLRAASWIVDTAW